MNTSNVKPNKAAGFSLIELLVVVAIVALLVAVAIPVIKSARTKSRMAETNSHISAQLDAFAERMTLGQSNANLTLPTADGMASMITNEAGTEIIATWPAGAVQDEKFQPEPLTVIYTAVENNGNAMTWTCAFATGAPTLESRQAIQTTYFTNPVCVVN